jgi:transcriptional regulator with XRE-family HTH domain
MKNRKKETSPPPLCACVKNIRKAYGESQPRFAERVGLASLTISRFERGVQIPSDSGTLFRLAEAARNKGLTEEAKQFEFAIRERENAALLSGKGITTAVHRWRLEKGYTRFYPGSYALAVPQWRLMAAAFIAPVYYPEIASAMEKAAGEALELVDEALRLADAESQSGQALYEEIERILRRLAEERALKHLRDKKDNQ